MAKVIFLCCMLENRISGVLFVWFLLLFSAAYVGAFWERGMGEYRLGLV